MLKEWQSKDRRSRSVFIIRDIDQSVLRDTLKMFTVETTSEAQQTPHSIPVEGGNSDTA